MFSLYSIDSLGPKTLYCSFQRFSSKIKSIRSFWSFVKIFVSESESTTQLQNAHTLQRPASTWARRRAMVVVYARASATEAASAARDHAHMVVAGMGLYFSL